MAFLACLAVATCGGQGPTPQQRRATGAAPGLASVAPAEVKGILDAHRGKVVVVNLWASWCLPCREEFPDLLRLHRELGSRGLDLVLISADFSSQRQAAQEFLSQQGVDFGTFLKAGDDQDFIDAVDPRWSGSLPATLVLKRDGTRAAFWEGKASYEQFRSAVAPLL